MDFAIHPSPRALRVCSAAGSSEYETGGRFDAVVIELRATMGTGVFAAMGSAARAAGSGILIGVAIAAVVA